LFFLKDLDFRIVLKDCFKPPEMIQMLMADKQGFNLFVFEHLPARIFQFLRIWYSKTGK